ncbi:MAG TPA: glycogen debranching N-terminal domain-containing protein [Ktedonobacterales bacterium]|nr:glycogen debranching N-terminal domain-containing protein [Ktedonobacterales bacterium]
MAGKTVSILEGNIFVVSDQGGNIEASATDTSGLFAWDVRFLSRWILTLDGIKPNTLSTDDLQYFSAQFFLVPGTGTVYVDADLSIIRKRAVGDGFHEDVILLNHSAKPVDHELRLEAASDFADLFEVKDALAKKGHLYSQVEGSRLTLGYRREGYSRETWITSSAPAEIDEHGLTFRVHIEPHGQWTTGIDVAIAQSGLMDTGVHAPKYRSADEYAKPDMQIGLDAWLASAPKLNSDSETLTRIYRRSLVDLAALRFYPRAIPGAAIPAAGLPWFMTVFGRDSLFTSYQALPFAPDMASATLRTLAGRQGRYFDDFRDEEPGRIMHEQRFGEMTAFLERPHSPYYGTADATQLFLVVLDEYERWTGDEELVRRLEPTAMAALEWIDKYADHNGDGYIDYQRKLETGLENQCWKDSWNSILFADGTLSKLPRATCELQGYAYDAKMRCARLAREIWNNPQLAERLEKDAADLKFRFNRDYWIPSRQFFALAIDGDGRQVDSLTSNIGHLLWSGIVDDDKAEICVNHLMSGKLFSGWGIRTMAEGEGGYNPIGYHVGTVWPFDNSFIAMGLRRYGYREEAAQVAQGILDAAPYFDYRLPEAFGGYTRESTKYPVEYPTACSPQAWSTGAPLLFLRTLLGLEPVGDRLLVDPAIPLGIESVFLLDIPGRWGRVDAFGRGRIDLAKVPERRVAPVSAMVGAGSSDARRSPTR